jgi:hypothetical protein
MNDFVNNSGLLSLSDLSLSEDTMFILPVNVWQKLSPDQRTDFTQQVHMLIVDAIIHRTELEKEDNDFYEVSFILPLLKPLFQLALIFHHKTFIRPTSAWMP